MKVTFSRDNENLNFWFLYQEFLLLSVFLIRTVLNLVSKKMEELWSDFFVFVFCFFIFVTTFLFWLNHCKRHSKVHAFPINTFKYTENWPNILWRSCSLFGHFSASYIKELNRRKKRFSNTAWKVSIFKVFLVCIFLHSCITEYFSVFSPIAGKYRPLFFTDPFHVVQGKN